jgi:hypothetical protein
VVIQELQNSLQGLPVLKRQSQLIGMLRQFEEKLASASSRADRVSARLQGVSRCFGAVTVDRSKADLTSVREPLRSAATAAAKAAEKLTKDLEEIKSSDVEKRFIAIQDYIKSADERLATRWKNYIEAFCAAYGQLASAVQAAHLPGAEQIRISLAAVSAHAGSPPASPDEADARAAEVNAVHNGLKKMGVGTAIGRFLVDAAAGAADPKAIDDPEIRQFIEDADLWRMLRVKLI